MNTYNIVIAAATMKMEQEMKKKIEEGKSIPSCRPIISNSGSNSEFLSAFVDTHSKHLVKKLNSYVEDTPDLLRILQNPIIWSKADMGVARRLEVKILCRK